MDPLKQRLMEDIADSLRRIAAALENREAGEASDPDSESRAAMNGSAIGKPESTNSAESSEIAGDDETSDVEVPEDRRSILRDYLASRGIKIKSEPAKDAADEVLDRIAVFIGSRYQEIEPFYKRIKAAMNQAHPISLSLRDQPQNVVSSTCQLADMLHKIAFLEEYTYRKAPVYQIFARPSRLPRALNFFSGGWLERYGVSEAYSAARSIDASIGCSHLSNVQISLPNGDDFELDILFEVQGTVFWFELKTGPYAQYVAKYAKISKLLGLDVSRSFMILTDVAPDTAKSLSALFQMTVTPVHEFEAALRAAIEAGVVKL